MNRSISRTMRLFFLSGALAAVVMIAATASLMPRYGFAGSYFAVQNRISEINDLYVRPTVHRIFSDGVESSTLAGETAVPYTADPRSTLLVPLLSAGSMVLLALLKVSRRRPTL